MIKGNPYSNVKFSDFISTNIFINKLSYNVRTKYLKRSTPVTYFCYSADSRSLTLINLKNFKSNKIDRFWRWDARFRKKKFIPISTTLILKEELSKKKAKKKRRRLKQALSMVYGLCLVSDRFYCITRLTFSKDGVEQSWYCFNDYNNNGKRTLYLIKQ